MGVDNKGAIPALRNGHRVVSAVAVPTRVAPGLPFQAARAGRSNRLPNAGRRSRRGPKRPHKPDEQHPQRHRTTTQKAGTGNSSIQGIAPSDAGYSHVLQQTLAKPPGRTHAPLRRPTPSTARPGPTLASNEARNKTKPGNARFP